VKDELEDLAFAELNPDVRRSMQARLDFCASAARTWSSASSTS
jgi:hypothetical protein